MTGSRLHQLRNAVFVGLAWVEDANVVSAPKPGQRPLCGEQLEPRLALSGDGLVPLGSQPSGALTGKIVYTHAGHGWTADNLGNGDWTNSTK